MASYETSPFSTPGTPSRRLYKKERLKMISQITLLDATMDGKIVVSLKIEDCSFVDDSSLSLLSMPDGPFMSSEPITPSFHSFVITVQNGQRIYGGSYIFGLKQIARNKDGDDHKTVYMSRALVAITIRPIVDQLKKLLEWCVTEGGSNPRWLRCLVNIRLPQKGKCILIHLPEIKGSTKNEIHSNSILPNQEMSLKEVDQLNDQRTIAIFRPFSIFPLFDYSYRKLFTDLLNIDNLLLIFTCALNEVQILIMSHSYYNLMLISECIVALLNPFKWQHVYVPILPSKLGLNYLDAPTPFIMGIHSRIRNYIKPGKISCFFDCDNKKVELNMDPSTLIIPPFIEELRTELHELIAQDPRLCSNFTKSDALKRVSELAHKYNVISDNFTYLDETKLNQKIRILFFKKMKKHILNKYQHFIAYVSDKKDQIRFDSVAYLSDQPLAMRAFLQNFVETQMFATFIDEAGKSISKKQKTFNIDSTMVDSYYNFDDDYEDIDFTIYSDKMIDARFSAAQSINLCELEDMTNPNLLATMSPSKRRAQSNLSVRNQVRSIPSSPAKMVSTALTAQTNWKVVESLLKEVKVRTKRILLAKIGSDDKIPSGPSSPSASNYEENTLIAALCDLIERIWSHARSDDYESNPQWESSKCPLWTHLVAFHNFQQQQVDESHRKLSKTLNYEAESNSGVTWTSLMKRIDSLSQLSLDQNSVHLNKNSAITKSISSNLAYDFKSICEMADIKSDVGKSRAFIRLSLERKLLSKHLRALLYNQDLLQSLYKRFAFLRCEEEREQFLTHLLTLNAVDLSCYTNTFTTSDQSYTLIIFANSHFNGSISITGSFRNTLENIDVDENQFTFTHKNFGIIYTLSLTVNINSKVYVEQCFIRNNVTNCLYKFECDKWFGKNIADNSIERLLIGQIVTGSINDHLKKSSNHLRSSSIGRNWTRSSEVTSKEEKYSADDLQAMVGESVNQIIKFYYHDKIKSSTNVSDGQISNKGLLLGGKVSNSSSTLGKVGKSRATPNCRTLISLFFGDKKFLWIINQIFYCGFKNRRSFRKQTFIWDYILRVQCELKHAMSSSFSESERLSVKDFVTLIDQIGDRASTYGKDMKFQLFILIALRDHKLSPNYLKLICRPQLAQLHYDNESFVRDGLLFTFLTEILKSFNEIEIKLDSTLTKNI